MTRTYVVTGAASGIGAATAELLRAQGHTVIGVDLGGVEVTGDLSTPAGRIAAADAVLAAADGGIDVIIACAGIAAPIAKTMAINYFGVTEFLTALLPKLSLADQPRAAVVSSMASLQPVSADLVDAALDGDEPSPRDRRSARRHGRGRVPQLLLQQARPVTLGPPRIRLRSLGRRRDPLNAVAPAPSPRR